MYLYTHICANIYSLSRTRAHIYNVRREFAIFFLSPPSFGEPSLSLSFSSARVFFLFSLTSRAARDGLRRSALACLLARSRTHVRERRPPMYNIYTRGPRSVISVRVSRLRAIVGGFFSSEEEVEREKVMALHTCITQRRLLVAQVVRAREAY